MPGVTFEKPPVPLVWLDTGVVVRLAKGRAGDLEDRQRVEAARLDEFLLSLSRADKIPAFLESE